MANVLNIDKQIAIIAVSLETAVRVAIMQGLRDAETA